MARIRYAKIYSIQFIHTNFLHQPFIEYFNFLKLVGPCQNSNQFMKKMIIFQFFEFYLEFFARIIGKLLVPFYLVVVDKDNI